MTIKEFRAMNPNELQRSLSSLREQARDLTFKIHSREIKNNHLLKTVRTDIARILTLMKEQ